MGRPCDREPAEVLSRARGRPDLVRNAPIEGARTRAAQLARRIQGCHQRHRGRGRLRPLSRAERATRLHLSLEKMAALPLSSPPVVPVNRGSECAKPAVDLHPDALRPAVAARWVAGSVHKTRIVGHRRRNYAARANSLSRIDGAHALLPDLPENATPYVFPLNVKDPMASYQQSCVPRASRYSAGTRSGPGYRRSMATMARTGHIGSFSLAVTRTCSCRMSKQWRSLCAQSPNHDL